MCDICNSPCKVCGKDLPLHLGDYLTKRNEVECFCWDHIPEKNVRVFTLTEDDIYEDLPYIPARVIYPKGWRMGIRDLTKNAKKNKDKNFPNVAADFIEEVV